MTTKETDMTMKYFNGRPMISRDAGFKILDDWFTSLRGIFVDTTTVLVFAVFIVVDLSLFVMTICVVSRFIAKTVVYDTLNPLADIARSE